MPLSESRVNNINNLSSKFTDRASANRARYEKERKEARILRRTKAQRFFKSVSANKKHVSFDIPLEVQTKFSK